MASIILLLIYIGIIAGIWKAYVKAGQPGWACIVPIYNVYVMAEIGGVKNWWLIFIPIYNIYFIFVLGIGVAKSFAKDTGFGIGLTLLGFVFWPILGFGDATYVGPNGENTMQKEIDAIGSN